MPIVLLTDLAVKTAAVCNHTLKRIVFSQLIHYPFFQVAERAGTFHLPLCKTHLILQYIPEIYSDKEGPSAIGGLWKIIFCDTDVL